MGAWWCPRSLNGGREERHFMIWAAVRGRDQTPYCPYHPAVELTGLDPVENATFLLGGVPALMDLLKTKTNGKDPRKR